MYISVINLSNLYSEILLLTDCLKDSLSQFIKTDIFSGNSLFSNTFNFIKQFFLSFLSLLYRLLDF